MPLYNIRVRKVVDFFYEYDRDDERDAINMALENPDDYYRRHTINELVDEPQVEVVEDEEPEEEPVIPVPRRAGGPRNLRLNVNIPAANPVADDEPEDVIF